MNKDKEKSIIFPDDQGPANPLELAEMVIKAAESGRKCNNVSSRLAHLRLANMRLHGREDDIKLLKTKLRDFAKDSVANKAEGACPELVLVSGISGTGKSALVMRGLCEPARKMGMAFAGGKFDLNNSALPLSAFVQAMSSLTEFVMEGDHAQHIREKLQDEFGEDDRMLLVRAMPGCKDLFSLTEEEEVSNHESVDGRMAISRLQYAIRRLLKVICAHLKGVVFFVDDLQWSDSATLELLKSISLDKFIPSLLMVGAYRQDEVTESHPLSLQIREKKQMGIEITTLKIGNLSKGNVEFLIAEALGMEDNEDSVKTLAAMVHKKTDGNAFFVLVFLRSLYDEKLLQYNFGAMKWIWDDDEVNFKLATENVATILVNKLKILNEESQNIMKIASCLGAKFSASVLALVTENLSLTELGRLSTVENKKVASPITFRTLSYIGKEETNHNVVRSSTLDSSVREFEREGLWEKGTQDVWRFSHDKVQSAAFELISPDKRDCFLGEIGDILMERLDPETLESSLFEVVSLRNCAMASIQGKGRRELAEMNLRAGIKASKNAAFDSAAVYFKAGRELMGSTGWEIDHDIMVNICGEGANACFINGDLEMMNKYIDEVLSKDIAVGKKFRVFEVKILAAQAASEFGECISLALEVRTQLGLPVPPNKPASKFAILKEYIKTNRALKSRTAEEIANLPQLTDERIIMGQRMLELLLASTYQVNPTMYPLIVFLLVRTSLKHGLNASSCDAFATLGVLLCGAFGDPQQGREMANAVDLILEKPGMARMKSRSIYICEALILHWTAPLHVTLAPLLEGYQIGLERGDVESAVMNIALRSPNLLFAGRPLDGLQHELEASIPAAAQSNQICLKYLICSVLLTVKKLRGVEIQGDDLDFAAIIDHAKKSGNQTLRSVTIIAQLFLLVIQSNWKAAKSVLIEAGDIRPTVLGMFLGIYFTFLEGLICVKAAQSEKAWSKRRIWNKRAKHSLALLRGYAKKGNVNVVHHVHLLTAEIQVLRGNVKKAEDNFKSAIAMAAKNGFMQDRALSHELAFAYFTARGDDFWANYHMESAKRCYSIWGAMTKVEQLTS